MKKRVDKYTEASILNVLGNTELSTLYLGSIHLVARDRSTEQFSFQILVDDR